MSPHIFEDDSARPMRTSPRKAMPTSPQKHTSSVGEILRGRKTRDASPTKSRAVANINERPLGERHINSPPPVKRVPLNVNEDSKPPLHKRTKSSISLRSLGKEKEKDKNSDALTRRSGEVRREGQASQKPKKPKSSTNLSSIFQKKSGRGGKDQPNGNKENNAPQNTIAALTPARSPLWEQFATQPYEDACGKLHKPERREQKIDDVVQLGTPQGYSEYFPQQQRESYGVVTDPLFEKAPQRPYLEHRSSRTSIFKEEDVDGVSPAQSPLETIQQPWRSRPKSAKGQEERPPLEKQTSSSSQASSVAPNRTSKVLSTIGALSLRSKSIPEAPREKPQPQPLSPKEIDTAFETLLDTQNIPRNVRDKMRSLDMTIKADLVRKNRVGSNGSEDSGHLASDGVSSSARSPTKGESSRPTTRDGDGKEAKGSKRSRSRPRTRTFTLSKGSSSPSKKSKNEDVTPNGRPKSFDFSNSRPGSSRSLKSFSSITSLSSHARADKASSPGDFIHYLREVQKPELVEIGKMHKLRILLRNETVTWTDSFITKGGMDEIVGLLYRIIAVEWREEHEDNLLHENLLCLKALCTTDLALQRLTEIEDVLFPALLRMLFDEEKKGPSEFSTRNVIVSLLFMHLSATLHSRQAHRTARARKILSLLQDPTPDDEKKPLGFISQMHVPRPYRVWCKEIVNVTKEVFWIFLHHLNVIPVGAPNPITPNTSSDEISYTTLHFPPPRPPHPAAPYVGGVEWEATTYLSTHLDLLNGLIASIPTASERNALREELQASGLEKCMGSSLRTCKEKFYGHVHDGLKCWVTAAKADGWEVEAVRSGPPREQTKSRTGSPVKGGAGSPNKKKVEMAPKLDLKLDVGGGGGGGGEVKVHDAWI
ncbi:MAG: hypothetical protein Q9160_004823 [Pyrenula sp. 1 TL-2023]